MYLRAPTATESARSKRVDFGPQYCVRRLAYRVISASVELLVLQDGAVYVQR